MPLKTTPLIVVCLLLAAVAAGTLHAQTSSDAAGPYVLRSVDFDAKGRSRPFVMMQKIDPYRRMIGMSFPDREALEAFIADRRQVLLNERVLASVTTSYEATPAEGGGFDVALRFHTVDTINIVVLPYPKGNTNTGLDIGLRGRDYNFLGSMQPLELNLDYFLDMDKKSAIGAYLAFETPVRLFGQEWAVGASENVRVPIGSGDTPASITKLDLNYRIPISGFVAKLAASQTFSYNALGVNPAAEDDPDEWFLTESLAVSATIPLTGDVRSLGPLTYSPSLSFVVNWKPGDVLLYHGREGATISFDNGFSFGRVDWIDNFRRGLTVSLSNDYSYAFAYDDFIGDLSLVVDGFTPLASWIGVAARISVTDRFLYGSSEDAIGGLGSNMRGIADARIEAFAAGFVNLSVPVKLFDVPMHLLFKKNWFDFGLQAQPFVDVGIVPGRADWFLCSSGLELLVFPAAFRSFIFRVSAGADIMSVVETGDPDWELSFGTGLAY